VCRRTWPPVKSAVIPASSAMARSMSWAPRSVVRALVVRLYVIVAWASSASETCAGRRRHLRPTTATGLQNTRDGRSARGDLTMTHAVPVTFQTTLGQRVQRAGAAGFAVMVMLAVLTPSFTTSDRPSTYKTAIGLLAFALPAVAGYIGVVGIRVVAGRDGILIIRHILWSETFTPWTQISHVQTRRRFGRARVIIMTLSGAKIVLPVPYSGLLLERNRWFAENAQVIRILKNESLATGRNE
jgi:hypothetical protein